MPELRDLMEDVRGEMGVEYSPFEPRGVTTEEVLGSVARGYGGRLWPEWKPEEVSRWKPERERKEPIGFVEAVSRKDVRRLAPFQPFDVMEAYALNRAARRQLDDEYEPGDYRVTQDRNLLVDAFDRMVEQRERKLSIGGWAANIVPNLPGFMAEFIVTGGVLGLTGASRAGAKAILKQIATKGARKAGLQAAAKATLKTMATAGLREVGMPHRVGEAVLHRLTPEFGRSDEGRFFVREARDKPFVAVTKALGDVYVEMLTEEAGAAIGAGLSGATGKVIGKAKGTAIAKLLKRTKVAKVLRNSLNKIRGEWMKRTGGTAAAFYRVAVEQGRFHGLIEEYGEERLGDLLRGVFDLSGEGNALQRIWQNMPGIRQTVAELGSFALIPAAGIALERVGPRYAPPWVEEREPEQLPEELRGLPERLGPAEAETLQRGVYEPTPEGVPLEIPEAPVGAVPEAISEEIPPVEAEPVGAEVEAPPVEAAEEELPEDIETPMDIATWAEGRFGDEAGPRLLAMAEDAEGNEAIRLTEAARITGLPEGTGEVLPPTAPEEAPPQVAGEVIPRESQWGQYQEAGEAPRFFEQVPIPEHGYLVSDAEVAKKSLKQTPHKRKGLTPIQITYLGERIKHIGAVMLENEEAGPFAIHVPDDGTFRIGDPMQALNLHRRIVGKNIPGEQWEVMATNRKKELAPKNKMAGEDLTRPKEDVSRGIAWAAERYNYAGMLPHLEAQLEYAQANPDVFPDTTQLEQHIEWIKTHPEEAKAFDEEVLPPTAPGAAAGAAVAAVEAAPPTPAEAPALEAAPEAAPAPPTPLPAIAETKKALDSLLRVAAPAVRGPEALEARRIIRFRLAELAQKDEATRAQLKTLREGFRALPEADRWQFVDDMEEGRLPRLPRLRQSAITLRKLLNERRGQVQALGKGKLEKYYENYFPHIWKDPAEAERVIAQILSKRPLRGPAAFLKKRSVMSIREGMEQGLTPTTDNPIDLVLLKAHEIDRYIMGENILSDLKEKGLAQFVYATSKGPEGYIPINDRVATVYAPPEMTMREAYDQKMVEDLTRVATRLGVTLERRVNVGGKRWGFTEGTWKVTTKFAGPESVLAHEIGHVIGTSYDLFNWLTAKGQWHAKEIRQELRDLADLKYEGLAPTPGFKRYVRKGAEKEAVLLEALIHAPEQFKETAPDTYKQYTKFLGDHAELRELLDIKPSLVLGASEAKVKIPGLNILGRYWATEPVATLLNNYTSPGLRGNILYDITRRAGNTMNQAQLALSGFHAGNTTLDVMGTQLGLGLREIFATKGMQLKGLTRIATLPASPLVNLWRGDQLLKEMRKDMADMDPRLRTMVEAVVRAGGRTRLDPFYYNQAIDSLKDTWRDLANGTLFKKTTAPIWIPWRAAAAALEATAKPLMEWLVPRQKLGAFYALAKHEMARLKSENVSDPVLWERLTQVWDNVDNRMGQLVYDNLFWNKTFKDVLMLSQRSVGWNLGSWREFGGAAIDLFTTPQRLAEGDTWLSQKQAYVIGVMSVYVVAGATLGYLMTGKGPDEWKDLFFIKTGKTNPDGTPERVSLPAYSKDIFAYAKHPISTLQHKLHPLWASAADILNNRDFYGTEIRHADDPTVKQLGDVVAYGAKQFIPFSVRNYMKRREAGATKWQASAAYAGIIKTPASMTRTPANELMLKYIVAKMPKGTRTREAFETSKRRKEFVEKLRRGLPVDVATAKKEYTTAQLKKMSLEARQSKGANLFKRLNLHEALNTYAIADAAEKKEWRKILATKMDNYSFEKPDYADVRALYTQVTK